MTDDNPQTPEDALEALVETIGGMTLAQIADLLGRLVERLDELALDAAIEEIG